MKIVKIIFGVFFTLVALTLLVDIFRQDEIIHAFEKLGAFLIAGGIAFWFIRSAVKKKKDNL